MQEKSGGRFRTIPDDIIDDIFCMSIRAAMLYFALIFRFDAVEDTESSEEWIRGIIRTNRKELIKKSNVSKTCFYSNALKELLSSGLVVEKDGDFILTKYKRKTENESLDSKLLHEIIQEAVRQGKQQEEVYKPIQKSNDENGVEKMAYNRIDESVVAQTPDGICDYFFKKLSRDAAKLERDKVLQSVTDLIADGYFYNEIIFCIDYSIANAKSPVRSFAYVVNGMGNARATMAKGKEKTEKIESREMEQDRDKIDREKFDREFEEILKRRDGLSDEQLQQYRVDAKQALIEAGTNPMFIDDILIDIKVNELIRNELNGG